MIDFKSMVAKLCQTAAFYISRMTGDKPFLACMCLGLAGETGELIDLIKKHIIYGMKLPMDKVKKELGDIEFYLTAIYIILNIDRQEVLDLNQKKLAEKYGPDFEYTDEKAIAGRGEKEDEVPLPTLNPFLKKPVSHGSRKSRCEGCGEPVDLTNNPSGTHTGCDWIYGRRGWRQLGTYDG